MYSEMWIEDILDPAYRKLQKLKELVREENASSKISAGIDEVIDLLKVCMTAACIDLFGLSNMQESGHTTGGGVMKILMILCWAKFFYFTLFWTGTWINTCFMCVNLFCNCGSRFFYLGMGCFLLSIVFYKNIRSLKPRQIFNLKESKFL